MFTFLPSGCWPVIVVSGCGRLPPFPSEAAGVFQPVSGTAPGSLSVPCPGPPFGPSCVHGVGHPAKFACLGNWSNRSEPSSLGLMSAPLSFQSLVVVVTQPASCA